MNPEPRRLRLLGHPEFEAPNEPTEESQLLAFLDTLLGDELLIMHGSEYSGKDYYKFEMAAL